MRNFAGINEYPNNEEGISKKYQLASNQKNRMEKHAFSRK